ncbi:hypothetical protein AB0O51_27740 [Streptomyces sp. NPDC090301]|uniref:hypothetical protein n=1 Tax=Streptomyces sp. NPDC090301 TaxID=3154975 RepID=UPI00341692B1
MAEDDDDHDDAAEGVFRRAIQSFPDDVGLLAGYTELCLRADALDRPSRHARGPVLLKQLRELAPDSPHLQQAVGSASVAAAARKSPSIARIQRHDAVRALAGTACPTTAQEEARQQAALEPYDQRLAVLHETLNALAAPVAKPLRLLLRWRPVYLFADQLSIAALLAVYQAAPSVPIWILLSVASLVQLPLLLLWLTLRKARTRAAERVTISDSTLVPSVGHLLPPVPRHSPRDLVLVGTGSAILLALCVTTGSMAYAEYTKYPQYEVVSLEFFQGMRKLDVTEAAGLREPNSPDERVNEAFAFYYVDSERAGSSLTITGSIGDFHDVTSALVYNSDSLLETQPGVTSLNDGWNADAGAYGGWMRCARYTEDITGSAKAICFWADKGSMGTVTFEAEDMPHTAVEQLTRSARQSMLRPAAPSTP